MTDAELEAFINAVRRVGLALIALRDERDQLRGELAAVDALLARRRALDDKPDRLAKIAHAIATARKAEP